MKKLGALLILFISPLLYSETGQLSSIIKKLDEVIEPQVNCEQMSDEELVRLCAESVCRDKEDNVAVITASNYHKFLTADEIKKVDSIPQEINNYFNTLKANAKLIDQKIQSLKNNNTSKEAQELIDLYPLSSKVDALINDKLKNLPDMTASCKSAMIIDIINAKNPAPALFQEAFQKMDQAVISKLSSDSAKKLRTYLKNNVKVTYSGLGRSPFHISYYKRNNPLRGNDVSSMLDFARKINSHVDTHYCSSDLSRSSLALLTDYVAHDTKSDDIILNISPYNCTHGPSTESIVAHEVGHMVTHFVAAKKPSSSSKKKFLTHRNCVKTQGYQIPDKRKTRRFSSDHLTTEEDHADALAFEIKNMNSNFCAMLASDGKDFTNLDFQQAPGSSHSPSLLRILRDFNHKGINLPDTCLELAKRHFPKNAFHKCSL